MNKIILFIITFIFITSCKNESLPTFLSPNDIYIKDSIKVGEIAKFNFYVKNSGNNILEILNHTCSCECTFVDIEKKGIKENDSILINGRITAYLNDKGKNKETLCTFKSNTKEVLHRIRIHYFIK